MIERLLAWVGTAVLLVTVTITMLGWHPVLVVTRWIHPYLHRRALDVGIGLLLLDLRMVGWRVELSGADHMPLSGPVVVLSNHQHLFDIPLLMWYLRRYYPKFVAKRELGRWFPCASYILRTGGSALIDRGNAAQALREISRLGELITKEQLGACIFPEGTRARDGMLKRFKPSGAVKLLESAPTASVVPVVIDGTWLIAKDGYRPIPWRQTIRLRIGPPLARTGNPTDTLHEAERWIGEELRSMRGKDPRAGQHREASCPDMTAI